MSTSRYLDDASIERLAELLDQRAVPHHCFNLEALYGYLSALAVSPGEPVPLAEWEPPVWCTSLRWDDVAEHAGIEQLLTTHYAIASSRVRHDGVSVSDHFTSL